jgi:hypothetical protein
MERLNHRFFFILIPMFLWGITLIFRGSYLVSVPPVNNVAHIFMLQTLDIWQKEGALISHFAMKHTYPNRGDKHITYYKRYTDQAGNNYYVSHPSLAQTLAWIFSGFGAIKPTHAFLMWLAMMMHLTGAFFIQALIRLMMRRVKFAALSGFFGAMLFLFHPVLLYMTGFHYFAESVGHLMFVVTAFFTYKYSITGEELTPGRFFILLLTGFLFVSAEWFGLFFIGSLLLIMLFRFRSLPLLMRSVIALSTGAILALMVFLIQHVSLHDAYALFKAMGIRFLERSGFFGNEYTDMGYSYVNKASYVLLGRQIAELMKGTGILFLPALVLLVFSAKKFIHNISSSSKILIFSMFLACFGYLVLMFSATITHYIYMGKWVVPLILISIQILSQINPMQGKKIMLIAAGVIITFSMLWSVNVFQHKAAHFTESDPALVSMASVMKGESKADESVFCDLSEEYPMTAIIWLSWSSGRNIALASDENKVCDYMANPPEKYIYFRLSGRNVVFSRGTCRKKGE